MNYIIRSDVPPDFALCENNLAASVLQNITLLVGTKQGTVPGYREYGLPMRFIGMPDYAAATVAAQEVVDAVERFEPRAKLNDVKTELGDGGKVVLVLEVAI